MIYTDHMGHLVSDTSLDELHAFANRLGLRRQWFQGLPEHRHPHYDLTTPKARSRALNAGAVLVDPRQLLRRMVLS